MKIAIGILAAVVVGVLAGRITAPPSTSSPAVLEAGSSPGPTRESVGVGVGFSRSREGAVLAAGSYQQAFADEAILKAGELRRRIEVVAAPRFEQTMLEANEPGAGRLAAGSFGQGIRAGVPTAFFGVPVAYRLLSFSTRRAVVQTWGFSLIGNLSAVEPIAYFGLARTELVWTEGDWKIADTRASFGPTPRLGSPRPGGEGIGLVELTEGLRPYGLAP
jgi:hypothetical protein